MCVGKHARVHAATLVRCCAACAGCGVCQAVFGLVVLVVSRLTCACSVRRAYIGWLKRSEAKYSHHVPPI